MPSHSVTLVAEGMEPIGYVDLPSYPVVGDAVEDADGKVWVVTSRLWVHEHGLTLYCR